MKFKQLAMLGVGVSVALMASPLVSAQTATAQLTVLLNKYTTFKARFVQTTYGRRNRVTGRSYGKVMLKRPGKFRWETYKPLRQTIVASRGVLWIYDISLMQATKQKMSSRGGVDPAMLLTGDVKTVRTEFNISKITRGGLPWFQLLPKHSGNDFRKILLHFSSNRLTKIRVTNNMGQNILFSFSKIVLNPRLSPSLFRFRPPRGVDVLKQ